MDEKDCCGDLVWNIIKAELPSEARVLGVGPGLYFVGGIPCPPMDIGLLAILETLESGSMTIFDLPSTVGDGGAHSPEEVKDYLDLVVRYGADLVPYEIQTGNIFNESIDLGEFDTIHDHMTWMWAYPYKQSIHTSNEERFSLLASRYASLLSDGGKAFCHYWGHLTHADERDLFAQCLEDEGFSVTLCKDTEDGYIITDPIVSYELTERGIIKEGVARPFHASDGLIIAEK